MAWSRMCENNEEFRMPFVLHVYLKLKIYPISKILHLHYVFPNTHDIHELKWSIICTDFQLFNLIWREDVPLMCFGETKFSGIMWQEKNDVGIFIMQGISRTTGFKLRSGYWKYDWSFLFPLENLNSRPVTIKRLEVRMIV